MFQQSLRHGLNLMVTDFVIRDICRTGYLLSHVPCLNRTCGGIGLLYKSSIKAVTQNFTSYKSFEYSESILHLGSCTLRVLVVYRPPLISGNPNQADFS